MSLDHVLLALKGSPLAGEIRNSLYLFPLIEATHVVALTLVFGTIMVVDLRILGVASTNRPFARVSADMLKWTWGAFILAAVTGTLMFITNARVYFDNGFFRAKFVLMALAGANMLAFQLTSGRRSSQWGTSRVAPPAAKAAAIASLTLWVLIIAMGRSVGFTTTGQAAKLTAPPPNINFEDFLNSSASSAPSAPPASSSP